MIDGRTKVPMEVVFTFIRIPFTDEAHLMHHQLTNKWHSCSNKAARCVRTI